MNVCFGSSWVLMFISSKSEGGTVKTLHALWQSFVVAITFTTIYSTLWKTRQNSSTGAPGVLVRVRAGSGDGTDGSSRS